MLVLLAAPGAVAGELLAQTLAEAGHYAFR